jgi:hypothetical protein
VIEGAGIAIVTCRMGIKKKSKFKIKEGGFYD